MPGMNSVKSIMPSMRFISKRPGASGNGAAQNCVRRVFLFILSLRQLKEQTEGITNAFPIRAVWKTEEVIENMPYRLTNAQMRVWGELERDLKGHTRMARLVQGDVGSGKTILAFLAMIMTAENGYQSALMVPTEVLARQHYESLCTLLKENNLTEYNPRLLTGSTKAKERREIYASLEDGSCKW